MHTYKGVYMLIKKLYVSNCQLFENKMQIVQEQEHVWQNEYHHQNHIEILHLSI